MNMLYCRICEENMYFYTQIMWLSTVYTHFVDNIMLIKKTGELDFLMKFSGKKGDCLDLKLSILYNCNDIFHRPKEV